MGIDLGNLAALRTFRVLRALKTVAIIPGKALKARRSPARTCNPNLCRANLQRKFPLPCFRLENYRRCCHRICEESAWCNHIDNVLTVCVCVDGPSDLHGRVDTEMHQEMGRLVGQLLSRGVAAILRQQKWVPSGRGEGNATLHSVVSFQRIGFMAKLSR